MIPGVGCGHNGRYLLIAPENAFKGDNYPVTVVNYLNEPADVTLEMSSKSTSGLMARTFTGVVQAKDSIKLDIPVPADVSNNFKLSMNLNYSQSSIQIKNSTLVPVKGMPGFLTIQTDKKMYKKNQKGVAKAEFLLSDDPALGYWKIYAEQKHSGSEVIVNADVTITVDKFGECTVMVVKKDFVEHNQCCSSYTYGENVVGDARLSVSSTAMRIPTNSQTLREGTTTFVLQQDTLKELLQNYARAIHIDAIVTEGSSKIELVETTSIKLTYSVLKVEHIGEEYYSSNNPYHFCVTITDDKGQLIPASERAGYQMTITRDLETPVQSLALSDLTVIDAKHVFCGMVRPPFLDPLRLQVSPSHRVTQRKT
uniref:Uncharacterized protein n=1 Tax=Magallana gigas TaxID=29159 RepID=K1PR46_MAGGI